LQLPLRPLPGRKLFLHGHCHEKAFAAVDPIKAVLALVPQLQVQMIESSCCGMAGSFGYDAEHFAVSMRMAELSLLPALRAAPTDAIVVANGTSCRHQISDGTRATTPREPVHVARVLERALAR
jgi:Fe-S oxidoreductase